MTKTGTCVICGKEIQRERFRHPPERTTCGTRCRNTLVARTRSSWEAVTGEKNSRWKGGQVTSQGYVYLLRPDHPHANKQGYVKRANLVMEAHLGRSLRSDEVVHHRNRNRLDDSVENLEVMTTAAHQHVHTTSLGQAVRRVHPLRIRRGESVNGVKVTEAYVRQIRQRAAEGEPYPSLVRAYGISISAVWKIVRRKTWTHVE